MEARQEQFSLALSDLKTDTEIGFKWIASSITNQNYYTATLSP